VSASAEAPADRSVSDRGLREVGEATELLLEDGDGEIEVHRPWACPVRRDETVRRVRAGGDVVETGGASAEAAGVGERGVRRRGGEPVPTAGVHLDPPRAIVHVPVVAAAEQHEVGEVRAGPC
jgi:hypothetical protein